MGCCKSRDRNPLTPEQLTKKPCEADANGNETASTNSKLSDLIQNWSFCENEDFDSKLQDIESYVSKLVKERSWISHIDKPDFGIRTIEGSKFCPGIPVVLGFVNLDTTLKASIITQALLDPHVRMTWDTSIKKLEIIGTYSHESMVLRVIKKFPFLHREFIVKVSVYTAHNVTTVVMYSPNSEVNTPVHNIRGDVLFTIFKIVEQPARTMVTCVQQVLHNSGREFCVLAASEHAQWMTLFKKSMLTFSIP